MKTGLRCGYILLLLLTGYSASFAQMGADKKANSNAIIAQQIPPLERVEPMNWWVGMQNPKLQLIVHGYKIADRAVKMSYPGVTLTQVHKVENPNYLFLDLVISSSAKPGAFNINFTKAGASTLTYKYELKQCDHSANRAQGVTNKDLVYLIMPDRFSNGDPTNDSVPGMEEMKVDRNQMYARHGGDIQGIMNHLDYLKDLGVTTIWTNPRNNQRRTACIVSRLCCNRSLSC